MKLLALAITATALRPRSTRLRAKRSEDDIGKQAKGFYIRPSAAIESKYQLATTGEIAHVVVTPSVTADVLAKFVKEYSAELGQLEPVGSG